MKKHELIESGLLEAYVLGLSSEDEKRLVEDMAAQHGDVAKMIEDMKSGMLDYCQCARKPFSTIQQRLSANPDHLLTKSPTGHRSRLILSTLGSVALLTSIFLALIVVNQKNRLHGLERDLALAAQEKHQLKERIAKLFVQNDEAKSKITFQEDLHTHPVVLCDAKKASHTRAIVFWDHEHKKACLHAVQLQRPPAGMTYRLWADVGGRMENIGRIVDCDASCMSLPYVPKADNLFMSVQHRDVIDRPRSDQVLALGQIQVSD